MIQPTVTPPSWSCVSITGFSLERGGDRFPVPSTERQLWAAKGYWRLRGHTRERKHIEQTSKRGCSVFLALELHQWLQGHGRNFLELKHTKMIGRTTWMRDTWRSLEWHFYLDCTSILLHFAPFLWFLSPWKYTLCNKWKNSCRVC